jgi:hypothetical protein
MELETGEAPSRRDSLKEALTTLTQSRNCSRQCKEEPTPMVTDGLGRNQFSPYIEDVAAMNVDEDLPFDELRQVHDNRMHVDSSFVSEPFDEQAPKTASEPFVEQQVPVIVSEVLDNRMHVDSAFVSEPFDEQEVPVIVSDAFSEPEIVSEPFSEQVSKSVAEPEVKPALESVVESLLYDTSSRDKSESYVFKTDEDSIFDDSGSFYSIDDFGDAKELIGEVLGVTYTEDEIEVQLGETSIIVEQIGGIKEIDPTGRNKVAEDDSTSEVTSVSSDDNSVDRDDYDSDPSWTFFGYSGGGANRTPLSQMRQEYEEQLESLNDEKRELIMKNYAASTDVQKAEQRAREREQEVAKLKSEITSLQLAHQRAESSMDRSMDVGREKEDLSFFSAHDEERSPEYNQGGQQGPSVQSPASDRLNALLGQLSSMTSALTAESPHPVLTSTKKHHNEASKRQQSPRAKLAADVYSTDANTVDTDGYDSDASWTSDSPLPDIFERLTGEISALTETVGTGAWF